MRMVKAESAPFGRAYLVPHVPVMYHTVPEYCVLTTGGIRIGAFSGAVGVMAGSVGTAARNVGEIAVHDRALASWAEEQGRLAAWQIDDPTVLSLYAARVALFGGDPRTLPILEFRGRWVSGNEIRSWREPLNEYLLVSTATKLNATDEIAPGPTPDEYGDLLVLNTSWFEF